MFNSKSSGIKPSTANYLFEGDFRRRPIQNLAGASRNTPLAQFIQQAADQRRIRDDVRRKETSATTIQAHWRGFKCRKNQQKQMRRRFDVISSQLDKSHAPITADQFENLLGPLLLLHHRKHDHERILWISQKALLEQEKLKQLLQLYPDKWLNRICKLLKLNLAVLNSSCTSNKPITTQLRLLEVFTAERIYSPDNEPLTSSASLLNSRIAFLWSSLIKANLFGTLRRLIDSKVPEPTDYTVKPPSPLAQSVADLLFQVLDCATSDENTQRSIVRSFLGDFFSAPLSTRVDRFYAPYLANKLPKNLHPCKIVRFIYASDRAALIYCRDGQEREIVQDQLTHLTESSEYQHLVYLCDSILQLNQKALAGLSYVDAIEYSNLIRLFMLAARYHSEKSLLDNEEREDLFEDDDKEDTMEHISNVIRSSKNRQYNNLDDMVSKVIQNLNKVEFVDMFINLLTSCERNSITLSSSNQAQSGSSSDLRRLTDNISEICYLMLTHEPNMAVFNCRFLHTLAFNPCFLRALWLSITTTSSPSLFGAPTPVYSMISRGTNPGDYVWPSILPQLNLFCSLFSYLLPTLDDDEFYGTSDLERIMAATISSTDDQNSDRRHKSKNRNGSMPFDLKTLVKMCAILRDVSVGLVQIIYTDYRVGYMRTDWTSLDTPAKLLANRMEFLFNSLVRAVRQLYLRDSRRQFCPNGHWISTSVVVPANKRIEFRACANQRRRLFRHGVFRHQTREELETQGPSFTSNELRTALILQNMPFTVSFQDRVQILHALVAKDKIPYYTDAYHFGLPEASTYINVRRNFLYEDSYAQLQPRNNEIDLKPPLRISLVNAVGLDEAGIDGGGVFKEFIGELLKTGFDPNRGFFKSTHDNLLYPNPSAPILFSSLSEGFEVHYEFLGRMLGKAIYEKIMCEIPFASFFLAKILATQSSSDVDIHHLASLDPVLHKNLMYLKNYRDDVADLGLDFTIANNDLGENEVVELKPSGSKIPVTNQNRIEYVHLVADYRLNKQIRSQCAAFKKGLSQLLDLHWVRMFDPRELQILISGAPNPIDIDDLRRNTQYAGGYSDTDPVICTFWRVVKRFDEGQKRKLLKFVTSVSKPPLLGFKDLVPTFSIYPAEPDRLPSASTCMNLLKLPKCEDERTMESKLNYSLEFNSGFELS